MDVETLKAQIAKHDVEIQKGNVLLANLEKQIRDTQATMYRIHGARQQCVDFLCAIEPTPGTNPEA